ncbi:hypothetical protein EYF80_039583 [Liparis tanakae]|uniref:Uncharacterized protein n=1 Tax=Liparis tanakae TaxID=230148 RepID=A0A4Z2GAG6_9TELE|nr:hypothetical protein EYF80_039583 [Liparis tanakae]
MKDNRMSRGCYRQRPEEREERRGKKEKERGESKARERGGKTRARMLRCCGTPSYECNCRDLLGMATVHLFTLLGRQSSRRQALPSSRLSDSEHEAVVDSQAAETLQSRHHTHFLEQGSKPTNSSELPIYVNRTPLPPLHRTELAGGAGALGSVAPHTLSSISPRSPARVAKHRRGEILNNVRVELTAGGGGKWRHGGVEAEAAEGTPLTPRQSGSQR